MKIRRVLVVFFLVAIPVVVYNRWIEGGVMNFWYTIQPASPPIYHAAEIDSVLNQFETVSFSELEEHYIQSTDSGIKPFRGFLRSKKYFKISRKELNQSIVRKFKVKDLVCKDRYYRQLLRGDTEYIYVLINRKLLSRLLELQDLLESEGYNPYGFKIQSAHRHPKHNKAVKGASKSRHIRGEALDLVIRDINMDGRKDQKDKKIILDLLDMKIIKNKGGIGRYPGTMTVHFDVRGYRARWDSY